jgi:phosphomevalonate kinase
MKTRAPGKVVLSGAYSVLDGAPAIVTAVSRYVEVDTERTGTFLTPEVRAAGMAVPLFFDASALRENDRKIGLGSSAAILLATLAARALDRAPETPPEELRRQLFLPALRAHQTAQGGGSGIDVASSCFGGTLAFHRGTDRPRVSPLTLPTGLCLEVWSSTTEASTAGLIASVKTFARAQPESYGPLITAQATAAEQALLACETNDPTRFLAALDAQRIALSHLGQASGTNIVTEQVEQLARVAAASGAVVIPAGAGGGDIALYVGYEPSTALDAALLTQRHQRLELSIGVDGVERVTEALLAKRAT